MKAYVFPGQGSQYTGMGHDIYQSSNIAKMMFENANDILQFRITDIMFGDSEDDLRQTKVTQPAIFLHSVILATLLEKKFTPDVVAGHSLGEFSALVACSYLSFEDGLKLVSKRASAMQKACEKNKSTMAAILGLENNIVQDICKDIDLLVVPANYNCPGQIVISGTLEGVEVGCQELLKAGAKRAIKLPVGGAFHSPIMQSAQEELEEAINNTVFKNGICPIYQNVNGKATHELEIIKKNLIKQLTAPVMWTQTMENMISDGLKSVTEVGPGRVLQGLFKKIDRQIITEAVTL
tara:strand:- start:111 stop:992 length:882 start_codon:yes stop_codon:yes gene_type:complete